MKNNKSKNTIIVLLVVIIIILGALVVLFATDTIVFKSNDVNNNGTNTNGNDIVENGLNENIDLPKWANYLLEQNITEIIYENGLLEEDESCTPAKIMTKEQLKSILLKMTTTKLRKVDVDGKGGPCDNGIIVKYDNKEFRITMGKYIIADGNDSYIVSLIEQEKYTFEQEFLNPEPIWAYEYDWDTSYIDTLF